MNDDEIAQQIAGVLRYIQVAERLRALLPHLTTIIDEIVGLVEIDEELVPEMGATLDHLKEASEAIVRCFDFATARKDVLFGEEE